MWKGPGRETRQELLDPHLPPSEVKRKTLGDPRSRDVQGKKGAQDRGGWGGGWNQREDGEMRDSEKQSPRQTEAMARENEEKVQVCT